MLDTCTSSKLKYMNIEDSIFTECNAHLKEGDKKRNQLASFYLVISGLLFSNYEVFGDLQDAVLGFYILIGYFNLGKRPQIVLLILNVLKLWGFSISRNSFKKVLLNDDFIQ